MSTESSRLRWRCRRGMRELDMLLVGWLERDWAGAGSERRDGFDRLLDCEDDLIWSWIIGCGRPEDRDMAAVIDQLRKDARK